jgi:perosamine synthetase
VLIGDNAESHYARTPDGMPLARAADMACDSYFANKVITTGEGGMVLTDDPKVAETLRSLRAHAFTPGHHFHHQRYALGCRMTEMQAALGLAQHHRYKRLLAERATIAAEFYEGLKHIEWLEFPKRSPGSVWWVFPMLVKEKSPVDRDGLRVKLAEAGVETRTYFVPMHQQPHLKKYAEGQSFPVAEYLSERGLYLGVYPGLTSAKIDYICSVIRKVA